MDSVERIQGLRALKPVSLLKALVAGHGYSLWPEDLALAGNMQVEASLTEPDRCAPNVTYTLTRLKPNSALLVFRLCWAQPAPLPGQPNLHFWHAILCQAPQSEATALALSDLALSLLNYYESNSAEIGETLTQLTQAPAPSWSERFFRLPQQLPSSLNPQMRALLTEARRIVPDVRAPVPESLHTPRRLQWAIVSGWLVSLLLLVLLIFALRG